MPSLFDTAADRLPQELQVLRETLWACWESDVLAESVWLNQIRVRACPEPAKAFEQFVETGVLVRAEGGFRLEKDA
jgi:hypothetical protein